MTDEKLPWIVILTIHALAIMSAGLVFLEGYEPWRAFLMVGAAAVGINLLAICIILLLTTGENRDTFWQAFRQTFQKDIHLLLKNFRIKR